MLQASGAGDIERRRREQFTLPPLIDLKTVQRTIREVAQALLEDRIDEDYAGELLAKAGERVNKVTASGSPTIIRQWPYRSMT